MAQRMTKNKRAQTLPDQLQLLYSSCVTEIGAFKEQQWKTTNYALLVYAAIVSVAKMTKPLDAVEFVVLIVVTVAALGTALSIIQMLDESIQIRRTRLTEIRKHFADEFMIAWGGGKPLRAPNKMKNPFYTQWHLHRPPGGRRCHDHWSMTTYGP